MADTHSVGKDPAGKLSPALEFFFFFFFFLVNLFFIEG